MASRTALSLAKMQRAQAAIAARADAAGAEAEEANVSEEPATKKAAMEQAGGPTPWPVAHKEKLKEVGK